MDLEELKQNWHKVQLNIELLKEDNRRLARQLATGRAQTACDKLASYYLRSAFGAMLLPVISPILVTILNMPVWLAVCYALFGIIMGVISILFYRHIRHCDYTSLSIVDALSTAVKIAHYQRYIRTFGIIVGGSLAVTMFYLAIDMSAYHIVKGFIVGFIVGSIFGVIKYLRMSALVRQMKNELQSLLEDKYQNL